LPNIAAKNGLAAVHEGVLPIRSLGYDNLAVLHRKPAPAGSELGGPGLDEVLLHLRHRAQIGNDLLLQLRGHLVSAPVGLHPMPEMDVIVMLAGIIEEPRILLKRPFDHLFQRLSFPLSTLEEIIPIVHVREVMLVVMIFERLT